MSARFIMVWFLLGLMATTLVCDRAPAPGARFGVRVRGAGDAGLRRARDAIRTRLDAFGVPEARLELHGDTLLVAARALPAREEATLRRALVRPGRLRLCTLTPEAPAPDGCLDVERAAVTAASPARVELVLAPALHGPFAALAQPGRRLAVLLDGEQWVAPLVRDAILDGRIALTGSARDDLRELAAAAASGPLPAPVELVDAD